MSAIRLHGIGKTYRIYHHDFDRIREILSGRPRGKPVHALQDIHLQVEPGEVVGVVGNNGAGKSTLLKIVTGTLMPSQGVREVRGRLAALLELGSGFHPELTGRENVLLAGEIMGYSREMLKRDQDQIIAFAGVGDFADQPVKTYSSGMFVRLAFSLATHRRPDILIIDEALSVGDGAFARKSFDRIMQFREQGATILFCSHSLYQIESLCNRAIWLDQGRIRLDGHPASVVSAYAATLASDKPVRAAQLLNPEATPASSQGGATLQAIRVTLDGQSGAEGLRGISGHSELRVRVGFVSDPALPVPSLGIGIMDIHGAFVASSGTLNDGIPLHRDSSGYTEAELWFPGLPLLKGQYYVDVYLLCEKALHIYDQVLNAAQFTMEQRGLEQGVVSLPHQWCPHVSDH